MAFNIRQDLADIAFPGVPETLPGPDDAFSSLKKALSSTPALGLPDYTKPFTLYCHERDNFAQGVLTQLHGSTPCPVAYFSAPLDSVVEGFPPCLKAVAAAAKFVEASASLVLGHELVVAVPHAIATLLSKTSSSYLSGARLTKYEALLLSSPAVSLTRWPILNPAFLLPLPMDGEPHDCELVHTSMSKPRVDLSDSPLANPDLILFFDGSCYRTDTGSLVSGYAVCNSHETLESGSLPGVHSAQVAELVALAAACHIAAEKSATIYTDSLCLRCCP
ncbi:hypothetical protein JRQ81_003184 [Phrynocephalus forsythii]|uniref:RNase H type-1 domain-containing protein n=1 Tax=Phrynocephalus forsythii TaxID=171643 RepID=A0A9Q0XML6_9SAUR|nr:hypothetical protein JRQ81_003184 [Phrynocephalus forsythii]